MLRKRDESRWDFSRHPSPGSFLESEPKGGAHSIAFNGQLLDMLIEDRGADTTLIVFHSALTAGNPTLPVMQGHGVASSANVNLVAVSDPSLTMGDLDLAWFIGNSQVGNLRATLSPLIQHAVNSLGGHRLILLGGSGGGYAAAHFGFDFPGSMVFAINPRLDLYRKPRAAVPQFLTVCYGAGAGMELKRARDAVVTDRIADLCEGGLPYDMLLFQNTGDTVYLNNQAIPFIESLKGDPRLYVRMEHTGEGHSGMPSAMTAEIVSILAGETTQAEAIRRAGFGPV